MRIQKLLSGSALAVVALYALACSTSSPEPSPQSQDPTAPAPLQPTGPTALGEGFPGYHHTFDRSRFAASLTKELTAFRENGFEKIAGEQGVFAVDALNGWALAVPNAGAEITKRPPFPGNADDHNQHAREYFRAAGIPDDQVSGVHVNTLMQGGAGGDGARVPDRFLGYYSVLERSIQGVPVVDSQAWVRFNVDGDVVEESIYWPALPASLADDIARFTTTAADHHYRAKLKAAVALDVPSGKLAIHHASSTDHRAFTALVTFDVNPVEHRKARMHHFDSTGELVQIPNETESSATPRRAPRLRP